MAKGVLRLVVDPSTGESRIVVAYHGDPGDLPVEHEDNHRRIVNQLIEGGLLEARDAGKVVVERGIPAPPHTHPHEEEAHERTPEATGSG